VLDHVSQKGQMLIHRVWLRSVKKWKMLKNGYNKFEKVSVRGTLILKPKGSVKSVAASAGANLSEWPCISLFCLVKWRKIESVIFLSFSQKVNVRGSVEFRFFLLFGKSCRSSCR